VKTLNIKTNHPPGAGYKANPTYDNFLREHSSFYRRHSAASAAQDNDRRASVAADANAAAAQQATENVRRGSIQAASGGAASTIERKGSVAVASDVERRESIFGMEPTAGVRMDEGRRPSTSLASDLFHKMKGGDRKSSH
jgi:hypothetical protein